MTDELTFKIVAIVLMLSETENLYNETWRQRSRCDQGVISVNKWNLNANEKSYSQCFACSTTINGTVREKHHDISLFKII